MRVGIIGAGAAGLASARQALKEGHTCDVLELAPDLGGTWLYTDDVGKDKYGFPVYSAMYKGLRYIALYEIESAELAGGKSDVSHVVSGVIGAKAKFPDLSGSQLRTNLPKEVMGFPDFPIPEQEKSYLTQAEILRFLNLYADHFNLRNVIKFNRHVTKVKPLPGNRWSIESIDKPNNKTVSEIYDAVMVCNGHYNDPVLPELEGQAAFGGKLLHSHGYRSPESFLGLRVLVIGAGPSGLDLTLQISKVANKVVLSHHSKDPISTKYPDNVDLRPDVKCVLNKEDVEFVDGHTEAFDVIFFCTGYKYCFPFLDPSCGVTVVENHIEPLYKHMIHIERPTMCFIGIPFNVCAFQMFDLQARFFVNAISGKMRLPSMEQMYEDTEKEMQVRWSKGYTKRQAHLMGPDQSSYYQNLAEEAQTLPIPPVIVKLRDLSVKRLYDDLINFREDKYRIVDEHTFVKIH